MKLFDRIMGLDPDLAQSGNESYENYRFGVSWVAVGGLALLGALVGDQFHLTVGSVNGADVALGTLPVMLSGTFTLAGELPFLTKKEK